MGRSGDMGDQTRCYSREQVSYVSAVVYVSRLGVRKG